MNNILPFLFSISISLTVSAQVPFDFEFLNHSRYNNPISEIEFSDRYLLTANNLGVDKISYDYTHEREMIYGMAENFKLIKQNDSTTHYMAWNIFDYDIGVGHQMYSYIDDTLKSEIFTYGLFYPDQGQLQDITYDTLGGWWCSDKSSNKLYYLYNETVSVNVLDSIFYPKLYTACNGDIYLIDENIHYFDGTKTEIRSDLSFAKEVLHRNGFNYLLTGKKLFKYDCELQNEMHSWQLPFEINSFDQIDIFENDRLILKSINEKNYEIYTLDASSNAILLHSGDALKHESIMGICMQSDSTYLTYGYHDFELGYQNFFRTKNTSNDIEYKHVDVSIDNYNIDYRVIDTMLNSAPITLEDVNVFDVTIDAMNNDEQEIYSLRLESNEFNFMITPSFGPTEFQKLEYHLLDSVNPSSIKILKINNKKTRNYDLAEIGIELTGANYRFLKNGAQVLYPELTSSILENIISEELAIFPNPASEFINTSLDKKCMVLIYDQLGKHYKSYTDYFSGAIDIRDLESGSYFLVVIEDGGLVRSAVFVKE